MALTLPERVLTVAASQVGVVEHGANDGPEVRTYQQSTGNRAGDPWCASFVSWCGKTACKEQWPLVMSGSVQQLFLDAQKKGALHDTPLPNDVMIVWFPSLHRYAHTGFVTDVAPHEISTIEGNTNPAGGREGYGVFRRSRPTSPHIKYLRWSSLLPSPHPKNP